MIEQLYSAIELKLKEKDINVSVISDVSVGGGSINDTYKIQTTGDAFFLKVNSAKKFPDMFEREFVSLYYLEKASAIRVPEFVGIGQKEDISFILMSFIEKGQSGPNFWRDFGQNLAAIHRNTNDKFGFEMDNYIGSLPQRNKWEDNWPDFFIHKRLESLVKNARDKGEIDGEISRQFDKLYVKLESFFPEESPALIHGDLWSGNFMSDTDGNPVIFDPAVYFGHREMDIGMSKLFGGFSHDFYEAYNDAFPMEKGWQERIEVANLYPLLVHVILFGGSYKYDVERILKRIT